MLRRIASLALVPLALAATTGCATFSDDNVIARVNDTELSEELLADLVSLTGAQGESTAGTGQNADVARDMISQWVQIVVVDDHLDEIGVGISDDARERAVAIVDEEPALDDVDDEFREFLIDSQAAFEAFNELPDPNASFAAAYDSADVYVDPRYGSFDRQFGVLPLGAVAPSDF